MKERKRGKGKSRTNATGNDLTNTDGDTVANDDSVQNSGKAYNRWLIFL